MGLGGQPFKSLQGQSPVNIARTIFTVQVLVSEEARTSGSFFTLYAATHQLPTALFIDRGFEPNRVHSMQTTHIVKVSPRCAVQAGAWRALTTHKAQAQNCLFEVEKKGKMLKKNGCGTHCEGRRPSMGACVQPSEDIFIAFRQR